MWLDIETAAPIHAKGRIVSSEIEEVTGARVNRVAFTSISNDAREAILQYILDTRRQAIIAP